MTSVPKKTCLKIELWLHFSSVFFSRQLQMLDSVISLLSIYSDASMKQVLNLCHTLSSHCRSVYSYCAISFVTPSLLSGWLTYKQQAKSVKISLKAGRAPQHLHEDKFLIQLDA